jgi:hypothetical protein
MDKKRALIVSDELYDDIRGIADKRSASINYIMVEALKLYRDYQFAENKSLIITDEVKRAIRAEMEYISSKDMNRVRSLLSSMAINMHVLQRVVAEELDLSPVDLIKFRTEAVENLKAGNRVFDLKEFIE